MIHGYSFLRETKNSRSLITILSNSKKGTRVLNIRKSRGSILIPGRFIQEIQALNFLVHDGVTTVLLVSFLTISQAAAKTCSIAFQVLAFTAPGSLCLRLCNLLVL